MSIDRKTSSKSKSKAQHPAAAFSEPEMVAAAKALPNPKRARIKTQDLPVVEEWVLASEAADLAGVSRQHLHACTGDFKSAANLSGFLAFRRAEILEWAANRVERFSQP